ncbi:hypothetical protein Tco_1557064 [Tanacetum coccineum]
MKILPSMWKDSKKTIDEMPQYYLTYMHELPMQKTAIQEMAEYSKKWHNRTYRTRSTKTSDGLAAIQAQLNNLGREIKNVNEKVYAAQEEKYRRAASGFYQRNNANSSYQERRQSMEESLSKFMNESAKAHEENSNLIKEI